MKKLLRVISISLFALITITQFSCAQGGSAKKTDVKKI